MWILVRTAATTGTGRSCCQSNCCQPSVTSLEIAYVRIPARQRARALCSWNDDFSGSRNTTLQCSWSVAIKQSCFKFSGLGYRFGMTCRTEYISDADTMMLMIWSTDWLQCGLGPGVQQSVIDEVTDQWCKRLHACVTTLWALNCRDCLNVSPLFWYFAFWLGSCYLILILIIVNVGQISFLFLRGRVWT